MGIPSLADYIAMGRSTKYQELTSDKGSLSAMREFHSTNRRERARPWQTSGPHRKLPADSLATTSEQSANSCLSERRRKNCTCPHSKLSVADAVSVWPPRVQDGWAFCRILFRRPIPDFRRRVR